MDYVTHEARLNKPAKDGTAERAHLEPLAAKGNARAIALLQGPPLPEALSYLYDWSVELHGKSGFGQHGGVLPLTYTTIADWSRLTGTEVRPDEVRALMLLDAIWLNPPEVKQ